MNKRTADVLDWITILIWFWLIAAVCWEAVKAQMQ